jgi:hypothetical protein
MPEVTSEQGICTADVLRIRSGPAVNFAQIGQLARGERFDVVGKDGAWYRIRRDSIEGFVHGDFVRLIEVTPTPGYLKDRPELRQVALPAATETRIRPLSGLGASEKRAASAWNSFGGLLRACGAVLSVDPRTAIAVLMVESSGVGFAPDGRLIIRFENHQFWDYWGKSDAPRFQRFFRFDTSRRWLAHQFRTTPTGAWRDVHQNQDSEWKTLAFARTLDENAALRSISMGLAQIMGFNHPRLGYDDVRVMFDAMQADVRFQILGFFDFLRGDGTGSPMIDSLQRNRFAAFASLYNGAGKAAEYGGKLDAAYEAVCRALPLG